MATVRVRHLVAKARGDRTLYYWQPSVALRAEGWKPQRLPDGWAEAAARAEQLNAELDAWRRGTVSADAPPAARRRAARPAAGTVAALIEDYRESRWWLSCAPATRRGYDWALEAIGAWAGDMPTKAITAPAVQAFYEAQLERVEGSGRKRRVIRTPAKAAAIVRVLRLLLEVGRRLGYALHEGQNPARKPGISLERQREPVIWTPEQVRHMAAAADTLGWRSVATAIVLNEWLGQREQDVLRLPVWRAEPGSLGFRQGKTGRQVALPVHLVPHLVARLRAEAEREGAVASLTHLLLHDRTRDPWNPHTFRHVFAEVRAVAAAGDERRGVEPMPSCAELRFMELRHTAVTRLHDAGADDLAIAGVTGHTPETARSIINRHYLKRSESAAARAFRARLAAEGAADGE
jgi:hypothetical protein